MEDRGEVLDLTAADAELELAAAVALDAVLLAVLVEREERPQSPAREGLTLIIFGGNGSAFTSSTVWMIASQVMRSCSAARIASVSEVSLGSSIHASGKASTTRR